MSGDNVVLGNVYMTGEFTNPGYVAARAQFWTQGAGGNWIMRYATPYRQPANGIPNDGNLHAIAMGAVTTSPLTNWVIVYEYWWWNGRAWNDYALRVVRDYTWALFGGLSSSLCAT